MNCIRCGKETQENHVFCPECLKDMENQPVKPGTPIYLPNRETRQVVKRSRFRVASSKWEDHIFRLKYAIVWLIILVVLLTLALTWFICLYYGVIPAWAQPLADLTPSA